MNRRSGAAVVAWLAVLAGCAWQIAHTRFVADLSSFLPSAPTPGQRLLVDQLRDGALSRVMLVGIEGATAQARAALSRDLAGALRGDARFSVVANGARSGFERERELVVEHRYQLGARVAPGRFTVEGLRTAFVQTLEMLGSSAGMLVKPLVPRDPTGETLAVLESLQPAGGPRSSGGVWVSADGRRAVLLLRTRASGGDTQAQAAAMGAVEGAFQESVARAGAGAAGARIAMTGPGVFSVRSRELIERDVGRLSLCAAAAVAALLLFVYRSLLALALGMLPVLTGAIVGIAAVSLGFGVVHGITLGFGATLIGEAVDYAIYLFVQGVDDADGSTDGSTLARFWPTVRLGVLTSVAGFCALVFSGLPGLAQLGVYSIAGLVAAALATRFVLPRLLPPGFRVRDVSAAGARIARLAGLAPRLRIALAALAMAAVAVLAAHRGPLWDPDVASLNPIPAADRKLDAELRGDLGASDARYLVLARAPRRDAALAIAERVGAVLDPLAADGRIGGYESPARFLPSEAAQAARIASLPDAATLRARVAEALRGLPLRGDRLEPFFADVDRARTLPPVTQASIAGTAFEAAVEGMLFRASAGEWNAVIGLRAPAAGGVDAAAVRRALDAAAIPGALLVDVKAELDALYAGYLRQALAMSGLGLLAIAGLLLAALRDARRTLRILLPLAAVVLVIAAAHALLGARLTIMHLMGLLLVVAIGSNYALFVDRLALAGGGAAGRTLASLALANATTVASFGVLAFSAIPVLSAIGSTVAAGAVLALVFSAAFAHAGSPAR